jgi:hypothetical protein
VKYIIRQPNRADREFETSQGAIEYMVTNPGYADLFHGDELVMSKGIPPHPVHQDQAFFRGLPAEA